MNKFRFTTLTAGIVACIYIPAFSQLEIVERLPDEIFVANWEPVFRNKIVSYVQLPGDSLEYKKVKVYAQYQPKHDITKQEELSKYKDLTRLRYLGAVLIRTGRSFTTLLDDSVLGVENTILRVEDRLINNEAYPPDRETIVIIR